MGSCIGRPPALPAPTNVSAYPAHHRAYVQFDEVVGADAYSVHVYEVEQSAADIAIANEDVNNIQPDDHLTVIPRLQRRVSTAHRKAVGSHGCPILGLIWDLSKPPHYYSFTVTTLKGDRESVESSPITIPITPNGPLGAHRSDPQAQPARGKIIPRTPAAQLIRSTLPPTVEEEKEGSTIK